MVLTLKQCFRDSKSFPQTSQTIKVDNQLCCFGFSENDRHFLSFSFSSFFFLTEL